LFAAPYAKITQQLMAVKMHFTGGKPMLAAENEIATGPELVKLPISVRTSNSWNELEQFRDDWNRLLRANPASSIFQTPEWLAAWWQAFGLDRNLLGLVFLDADHSPVGIAPMYTERLSFFGLPIAMLRMIGAGSGDSDALDFIVLPGYERHCAEAFATWLAGNKRWNVCALETLPENSIVAHHLLQQAHAGRWTLDSTPTPNFIVDLPPSWKQYLSSLEPSFRPLLTRYPRRLQTRYKVRMERCERTEDLQGSLDTLFSLHQMRWTGRGEAGAFSSAERRDFYFRVASAFMQRGWLEFWLLELDSETVGAQFCFRYNDTVSLLQEGFHPKYAAEKIGYALRAFVLEDLIRTGARKYDFLGGSDAYKAKFGARQANYLNLFFAGPSRLGRAYVVLQKQKRRLKSWLKSKLPASMIATLRRGAAVQRAAESQ
jgi:CelD/BcsL family acetyltransferase involved in cellulose biosynthesis